MVVNVPVKPGAIIRVWVTETDWRLGIVNAVAGDLISIDYDSTGASGYTFDATCYRFEILIPYRSVDIPKLFAEIDRAQAEYETDPDVGDLELADNSKKLSDGEQP